MRFKEFSTLLEYSRQVTQEKFGQKMLLAAEKDSDRSIAYIKGSVDSIAWMFERLEEIDPTPHKEYTLWLVKIYSNQSTDWEDIISRGPDDLEQFNKLKIKKMLAPEHRDINRFPSLMALEAALRDYPDIKEQQVDKGNANEHYKDADLRIIVPLDQTAACYYGQGTKWCTAASKNNMFKTYNDEGELYIVIPTKPKHPNEKFQFHFESGQFMDETDAPLNMELVISTYPQLKTIFAKQAKENISLPFLSKESIDRIMTGYSQLADEVKKDTHAALVALLPTLQKYILRFRHFSPLQQNSILRLINKTFNDKLATQELASTLTIINRPATVSDTARIQDRAQDEIIGWIGDYFGSDLWEICTIGVSQSVAQDIYMDIEYGISDTIDTNVAVPAREKIIDGIKSLI